MCAVCFSGIQVVPAAAVASRAMVVYLRGRIQNRVDDDVTLPESTDDDRQVATATTTSD